MTETQKFFKYLDKIESHIPQSEIINTKVSKSNVAWHLDHNLKVINAVITTMQSSDPQLYEEDFSFLGKVLLTFNYFPRGKAKAPKHVLPSEIITTEAIIIKLAEARENIKGLHKLDKNAHFRHPMFGNVNKGKVVKFLKAHTHHHLKIVKDILK